MTFPLRTTQAAAWARCAKIARRSQSASLELAFANARHTPARKAWLESARLDGERKRSYQRYRSQVESQARIEAFSIGGGA